MALLAAARLRFTEVGFAGTSLDDVAAIAGTTKGAVYHHFKDKKALFRAVYVEVSRQLIAAVATSTIAGGSPGEVALHAFLIHAGEPACQRVLFTDGPVVLGAAECRAIDTEHSQGLLNRLIEHQVAPDLLASAGSETLAKMLLAVFVESAHIIASSAEPEPAMAGIKTVLNRMIVALSVPPQDPRGT
ncbi:TetR/AcrR family transcriptional regulator [Aquabacterium sp.]|uniref:TetR/AcrR family transcriptional regulator n=1 Tax=Aquabacterium sp. TaxID=1872578 RepID=UPI003D6D99AD